MNYKEEQLLKEITNYLKKYQTMPTRRYLQKKLNYKSINSVTQYIKSLINNNYLKYNDNKQLIVNSIIRQNENIKRIKVINMKNKYLDIVLNKRKKYCAFKIHNNYFNNMKIYQNDYLIIEITNKIKINNLGLFLIDNKYRIMKYNYKDGFFILKDNEELILNKVNLIGKIIMIERII